MSCKLLVDGKELAHAQHNTASGGYNLAQCEISKDPLTGKCESVVG